MAHEQRSGRPAIPPRWVYRALWALHRASFAISGGRLGLRRSTGSQPGTMRLHTVGRRSGQRRTTMLTYLADGANLVVVGSNAGSHADPAWWLNLQAEPHATVDLPGGSRSVVARLATGAERERLWAGFVEQQGQYERYARASTRVIPVVILELADGSRDA